MVARGALALKVEEKGSLRRGGDRRAVDRRRTRDGGGGDVDVQRDRRGADDDRAPNLGRAVSRQPLEGTAVGP